MYARLSEDGMVEEVDMSDKLLQTMQAEMIDALISVVGGLGLSIASICFIGKGLNTVCIPRSIENDIAATIVSFGFNSTLSFTIEMLDRVRQAAQSARKIAVVEVLGEQAGWIALQARHCRLCRCGADSRGSLRSSVPWHARLKDKITPRSALRTGGGGRGDEGCR